MSYKLLIYNPSEKSRGGFITIPWQPIAEATGYSPDKLKLFQDGDTELKYYQVDQIDPDNPSYDRLSFFLAKELAPGPDNYSRPSSYVMIDGTVDGKPRPKRPAENKNRLELSNQQLDVRFNLCPESEGDEGFWYAGSVRSVRPEKKKEDGQRIEFLDYPTARAMWYNREHNHDPEKRCLQIESLDLAHPNMGKGPSQRIYLFNQPYRLISESTGPVRKCLAIASRPFYYNYSPPLAAGTAPLQCELYRILSLYEDRDFILEEMFINVKPHEDLARRENLDIHFTARYFTYICMGVPHLSRYESVPDWFSVADLLELQGYGFATDVHVDKVQFPHAAYQDKDNETNTFSWALQPCTSANCLHLFSRFSSSDIESEQEEMERFQQPQGNATQLQAYAAKWFEKRIGHHWYEHIYKPILAQSAARGEAYVF